MTNEIINDWTKVLFLNKEKNPRFYGLKREKFAKQFNFSLQGILKMHKLKRIQSKACKKLSVKKIIELFFTKKVTENPSKKKLLKKRVLLATYLFSGRGQGHDLQSSGDPPVASP